ncbi:MAG: GIY-YIG nuclease family protein [Maribacter sp.]|nr:GIY-YIG nuclease family protein [Maribacter sp.]
MYSINHQYYVYILTNKKNGTLYIGMTNNLERRIYEHKNKLIDGFTNRYGLDKLVFVENYEFVQDAITREKRMKKWKRQWKIILIEVDNPQWNDLASEWFD